MATLSASIIGANYTTILANFGCKSEATKCAPSLFGAQETHCCNRHRTPYIFNAASKMTVPICVDDVSEKSGVSWEELIIDAWPRNQNVWSGSFSNTSNALCKLEVDMERPRAHTRLLQIAHSLEMSLRQTYFLLRWLNTAG